MDNLDSFQETESTPNSNKIGLWQVLKNWAKIFFALLLLVKGIIGSFNPTNTVKLYARTQVIVSYIAPKMLMFKRSFIASKNDALKSPRIIEILPTPLHLIIALSGLEEAKNIMKTDAAAQLITPNPNISIAFNSTLRNKIFIDTNSTTIFESLAFSWCEAFKKNKIYPTKLIVTGPAKISSCIMGRYRWALKIPKDAISFRPVNSTEISPNFSECPQDSKDPFDCRTTKNREEIRFKYSQMCPELAPILLACGNRQALETALNYIKDNVR